MSPKTKMKIRMAVSDYQGMFPEDNKLVLEHIAQLRNGLKEDFATLTGSQNMGRHLTEIPEKLAIMIGMKLNDEERLLFRETENMRWFAKEFPQFAITKEV